jgi:ATP-dependent Clp protease ATP-binding subunit ClpC
VAQAQPTDPAQPILDVSQAQAPANPMGLLAHTAAALTMPQQQNTAGQKETLDLAFSAQTPETTSAYVAGTVAATTDERVSLLSVAPALPVARWYPKDFHALSRRLEASFSALAEDPYRPKSSGPRRRAALEAELTRGIDGQFSIKLFPGATYRSADGQVRYPGVAAAVALDPGVLALLREFYERLPSAVASNGVRVGLHQISVEDGDITPEGLHQDHGADYLGMWVAGRHNADGAATRLTNAPGGAPTSERVLEQGEALLFDNRSSWHEVTPLRRHKPGKPARRDVFILAFRALPASKLDPYARTQALAQVGAELTSNSVNPAVLKRLHDTGDPTVQRVLAQSLSVWARFRAEPTAFDGPAWSFLRHLGPWASYVFVARAHSMFEFLNAVHGGNVNTRQEAASLHEQAQQAATALIAAAEKASSQGLDKDVAAATVIDSAFPALLLDPVLEHRQAGPFDRETLLDAMAQRLKDTVWLYTPMTVAAIRAVLRDPTFRAKMDVFIDHIEHYLPDGGHRPDGGAKAASPAATTGGAAAAGAKFLSRHSVWVGLAFVVAKALWTTLTTGSVDFGLAATAVPAFMAMAAALDVSPSRQNPDAPVTAERGRTALPPSTQESAPPSFLIDLTAAARRGELGPIYLRDDETTNAIQILNQESHNNIILIGETGVGKTAIAEGLAVRMAQRRTGTPLDGHRVVRLNIGVFLSQAAGDPSRFASAVEEVVRQTADGRTVLVIDEAQSLARDPAMPVMFGSFFDQIKQVMTEGRLKLIISMTRADYNRYLASDAAIGSRSQILQVDPVAEGAAIELLYRLRGRYEKGVTLTFGAVKAAVELTVRVRRFDAPLLRMAIMALDRTATRLRLEPGQARSDLLGVRRDILHSLGVLARARADGDVERQESVVKELVRLVERYTEIEAKRVAPIRTQATAADVAKALRELGAPVHALEAGTSEHLATVEALLRQNYIGHDDLVVKTIQALKRRFAQPNARRPVFSTMLLGPTGTGKTEFARLLGRALFGLEDPEKSLIKINGGEYTERHFLTRLMGAPPSYKGFGETETLLDQVRRNPESIILIDEIEKMHPEILNVFLGILEDGAARDSRGRLVDFSHTVVVCTSNFGLPADYASRPHAELIAYVRAQLALPYPLSPFKPEFKNRLDVVDVFTTLSEAEIGAIVDLRLRQVRERWKALHGVEVAFADEKETIAAVIKEGFSPENGARAVNRLLDARLDGPLAERLVAGSDPADPQGLRRGDRATVRADWAISVEQAPADQRVPSISAKGAAAKVGDTLEAFLASRDISQPLTLDELDGVLQTRIPDSATSLLAPRTPLEGLEPSGQAAPLRDHRPNAADEALQDALAVLEKDVSRRPQATPATAVTVARALVLKAKRLGLEAAVRKSAGHLWEKGFEDFERDAAEFAGARKAEVQRALADAVQAAGSAHAVQLAWEMGEQRLLLRVTTTAPLTYEEEDKLLRVLGGPETSLDAADRPSDIALYEARRVMAAAGGRFGYHQQEGRTTLWAELPLPAAATADQKAPVVAEAPPAETTSPAEEAIAPLSPAAGLNGGKDFRQATAETERTLRAQLNDLLTNNEFRDATKNGALERMAQDYGTLLASRLDLVPDDLPALRSRADALSEQEIIYHHGHDPDSVKKKIVKSMRFISAAIQEALLALASPEQAALCRRAMALLDPDATTEAVLADSHAVAEAIEKNPDLASAALENVLWDGVDAHRRYMAHLHRDHAIEDSATTEVNGRLVPSRRYRELHNLYRALFKARPDLVPPGIAKRLRDGLSAVLIQNVYSYRDGRFLEPRSSEVRAWMLRQAAELALVVEEGRPDIVSLADLLVMHDSLRARRAEVESLSQVSFHAWLLAAFLVIVGIVHVGVVMALWPLAYYLSGSGGIVLLERIRQRAFLNPILEAFLARIVVRARKLSARTVLQAASSFDDEAKFWKPRKGRKSIFKAFVKDRPDVAAEARGKALGTPQGPSHAGSVLDWAQTAADPAAEADAALDSAIRLARALQAREEQALTSEVEAALRGGIEAFLGKTKGDWESLQGAVSKLGMTMAPRRRFRETFALYAQLAALHPELVPAAFKETLTRAFALPNVREDNRHHLAGYVEIWAAQLLESLDRARPGFISTPEVLQLYRLSGAGKQAEFLEAVFVRNAQAGTVHQVLDLLAESDAETARWFAKKGFERRFARLARSWPQFRQAAAGLAAQTPPAKPK